MKAIVFHELGGPEVLHYEDIDTPEPGPGEVLVAVRTCTVNRGLDTMVRANGFGFPGFSLPHISGADPSGVVAAIGPGVTGFAEGDRVVAYPIIACGECDFCHRGIGENYCRRFKVIGVHTWGGYADYVKLPAANVAHVPDAVAHEAASALPVSYLPAYHGIVTLAELTPDDTILVMAAGSGIGMAAIDIATMVGARVIATAGSDWKLDKAREMGAEIAVSYADDDWADQVREANGGKGVNVVFDNIGAETWPGSLGLLDRHGRMVCSGATGTPQVTIDLRDLYRNMTRFFLHMQGTSGELRTLLDATAGGQLAPVIDRSMPLREAVAAQALLADRATFGKVVLQP